MRVSTGTGLIVFLNPYNVVSIQNYRLSSSQSPMRGMCEIVCVDDLRLVVDISAEKAWELLKEGLNK